MSRQTLTLRAAPPCLLAAGLLFWGWQTSYLVFAIVMACLLESARLFQRRITITDREFNHLSDASSILFLITIIYVFNEKSVQGIYTLLSLLPFLFYPLILAQIYSSAGKIKATALFLSLRKLQNLDKQEKEGLDLSLPYLLLCIISASAGNQQSILFFTGLCLLVGWVLWLFRPRRYSLVLWFGLLGPAFGIAYAGQVGIQNLQAMAESTFLEWFDRFMWRSRDPDRTTTAIGTIGKLKLSDRIMVRVKTGRPLTKPLLLREATYSNYSYGVWTNYDSSLLTIDPELNGREWQINETTDSTNSMTVSFYLDDKTAVIPVPQGITTLLADGATQVEASAYGIVRLEKHEGWTRYDTRYVAGPEFDAPPDRDELELPPPYKTELERLATELGLYGKSPDVIIETVKSWFADHFTYSLTQEQRYPRGRHLIKFLLQDRKGHCEFFATATALLLRAAGIPTRYVVGYSVQEYSPLENQYIVRASYAHSWVQAWVRGGWQVIDTTPAIWAPLEDENRTLIEPLVDFWSWLVYRFSSWESDATNTNKQIYLAVLLAALVITLIWRLLRQAGRTTGSLRREKIPINNTGQGTDSGFYRLMKKLEKTLPIRGSGETLHAWLRRTISTRDFDRIRPLLTLHYRYRFDPDSCNNHIRGELDEEVNTLLSSGSPFTK